MAPGRAYAPSPLTLIGSSRRAPARPSGLFDFGCCSPHRRSSADGLGPFHLSLRVLWPASVTESHCGKIGPTEDPMTPELLIEVRRIAARLAALYEQEGPPAEMPEWIDFGMEFGIPTDELIRIEPVRDFLNALRDQVELGFGWQWECKTRGRRSP